jgi:hypothetical protein
MVLEVRAKRPRNAAIARRNRTRADKHAALAGAAGLIDATSNSCARQPRSSI